jgi:Family of unknown function (DUF6488)
MNHLVRFVAAGVFALLAGAASAHPNHDGPPISKAELPGLGQRALSLLVDAKQLAPSWRGKPVKEVSSRQLPEGILWIVTADNPGEADPAKRTVYMFFDELGNFVGGNHTRPTK